MTMHLGMKYECLECGTLYIPYSADIVCPKCADKPDIDKYPVLVHGICESFQFNLAQTGSFTPGAWATMDISDAIQIFFFQVFDKWKNDEMEEHEPQERTAAFAEFLKPIMEKVNMDGEEFMKDYIRNLALAVYNEFFNIRGIDILSRKVKD